jgi:hypothetical protein
MKRFLTLAIAASAILSLTASTSMAQASLSQFGQQQQGGSGAFQQSGQLSTTVSNASGTFVGADSSDVSNFRSLTNVAGGMNSMGMMGMGGMGMMGMGGMGRGGMGGFGRGGMGRQQNDPRAQLRIPMRIAFARPVRDLAQLSSKATFRLTRIPSLSAGNKVSVSVNDDGLAVVTGSVVSERDSSLIERLLELEAGVKTVQNDLVVNTPN